jgi:hypothetical protein
MWNIVGASFTFVRLITDIFKVISSLFILARPRVLYTATFGYFNTFIFGLIGDEFLSTNIEDPSFSLHLKTLVALAFVPPCDVAATFEEIDRSTFFADHKEGLELYMD